MFKNTSAKNQIFSLWSIVYIVALILLSAASAFSQETGLKLNDNGNNRADFTFIAGGVVPGIPVLKPDYPEHMKEWPFLWGENEYVINICAEYILPDNSVIDPDKAEK